MKRIFWIALLCAASINAFASDITLDLRVSGDDQRLTVSGKTNLPPKTILAANVAHSGDHGGDGFTASLKGEVSDNQVVQFGPYYKDGGLLPPGVYMVTVATVTAAKQPQEIQPFFGAHGVSLTGRQVVTLEGTSERIYWQTLDFRINPDGSISSPAPSNSLANNSLPSEHLVGQDSFAGGSPDAKWQRVHSDDRQEILVMTNGIVSRSGFHTYIVENLPESDIVGAAQSVMTEVEGSCETRHYHVRGSLFFEGKNRTGMPMEDTDSEEFERKLIPGSPFEKAFDLLCQIGKEQK